MKNRREYRIDHEDWEATQVERSVVVSDRTTNPIERFMGEVEKATGHVPVWETTQGGTRHVWVLWKRLKHRSYRPKKTSTRIYTDFLTAPIAHDI